MFAAAPPACTPPAAAHCRRRALAARAQASAAAGEAAQLPRRALLASLLAATVGATAPASRAAASPYDDVLPEVGVLNGCVLRRTELQRAASTSNASLTCSHTYAHTGACCLANLRSTACRRAAKTRTSTPRPGRRPSRRPLPPVTPSSTLCVQPAPAPSWCRPRRCHRGSTCAFTCPVRYSHSLLHCVGTDCPVRQV